MRIPHRLSKTLVAMVLFGALAGPAGYAEAAVLLKEAVRIAPNDPKCHEQLARALDQFAAAGGPVEDAEQAQKEMLEAVRLDPSNARLHFQLGLMYRRAGKRELSREQTLLSGRLYGSHSTPSDH